MSEHVGTRVQSLRVSDDVPGRRGCASPRRACTEAGRRTRLSTSVTFHALPVLLGRCPTRWPTLPHGQTRRRNRLQTAPSSDRLPDRSRSSRDARPGTPPGRTITLHPHERNPGAPPIMNERVLGDFDGRRPDKGHGDAKRNSPPRAAAHGGEECGRRREAPAAMCKEAGQRRRRRDPTRPVAPRSATAPGAGTITVITVEPSTPPDELNTESVNV